MKSPNCNHPCWQTLHWVLIIGIVGVVLKINATTFDETEMRSLVQIGVALAGAMGAKTWLITKAVKDSEKT